MPNAANIATTPKIDIVLVILLINWIITSATRQKILFYNNIYMNF